MQVADLQVIKDIPGFKVILKAILKSQIQQMVSINSVYLTACKVLYDYTATQNFTGIHYIGSLVVLSVHILYSASNEARDIGYRALHSSMIPWVFHTSCQDFNPCPAEPGYTLPLQTV